MASVLGRFSPFVNIQKVIIIIFHSSQGKEILNGEIFIYIYIHTNIPNAERGENPLGICLQRREEHHHRGQRLES